MTTCKCKKKKHCDCIEFEFNRWYPTKHSVFSFPTPGVQLPIRNAFGSINYTRGPDPSVTVNYPPSSGDGPEGFQTYPEAGPSNLNINPFTGSEYYDNLIDLIKEATMLSDILEDPGPQDPDALVDYEDRLGEIATEIENLEPGELTRSEKKSRRDFLKENKGRLTQQKLKREISELEDLIQGWEDDPEIESDTVEQAQDELEDLRNELNQLKMENELKRLQTSDRAGNIARPETDPLSPSYRPYAVPSPPPSPPSISPPQSPRPSRPVVGNPNRHYGHFSPVQNSIIHHAPRRDITSDPVVQPSLLDPTPIHVDPVLHGRQVSPPDYFGGDGVNRRRLS